MKHRYSRWKRVAEVVAFRPGVVRLLDLKYGVCDGQPTYAMIAGEVKQYDIVHSRSVKDEFPLILGQMGALAFRIAAQCGQVVSEQTHEIVSIKILVTPSRQRIVTGPLKGQWFVKGDQLHHWSGQHIERERGTWIDLCIVPHLLFARSWCCCVLQGFRHWSADEEHV